MISMSPLRISLADGQVVATGHKRSVHEHPAFPGMLIKVVRPERIGADGQLISNTKRSWYKPNNRLGAFTDIEREVKEFLVAAVRPENWRKDWPIQKFYGFVETELGLGLAVERLSAPDGTLAPTLRHLRDRGQLVSAHRSAMQNFFADLQRFKMCVGNMHERNIVFVGTLGDDGRFVGIDGLGDGSLVPLADFFPGINRRKLAKRSKRIFDFIDSALASPKVAA